MVEAGKLTKRAYIQRRTGAQTATGNEDPTAWADIDYVWMEFVPMSGRERMSRFQEVGVGMELLRLRYYPGLTRKDRIRWTDPLTKTDRYYDIQDIQEFLTEREQVVIALEVT